MATTLGKLILFEEIIIIEFPYVKNNNNTTTLLKKVLGSVEAILAENPRPVP